MVMVIVAMGRMSMGGERGRKLGGEVVFAGGCCLCCFFGVIVVIVVVIFFVFGFPIVLCFGVHRTAGTEECVWRSFSVRNARPVVIFSVLEGVWPFVMYWSALDRT